MIDDLLNLAADAVAAGPQTRRRCRRCARHRRPQHRYRAARRPDRKARAGGSPRSGPQGFRRPFLGDDLRQRARRADAIAKLAETAVAMARLAPPDPYCRSRRGEASGERRCRSRSRLGHRFPMPIELKQMALAAEAAALGVEGVSKVGWSGCLRRGPHDSACHVRRASRGATGAPAFRSAFRRLPARAPPWSAITIIPPPCISPISNRRRRWAPAPAAAPRGGSIRAR